ncbi:MAG: hypothetical protein KDA85_06780, partial [Planctomycetaceae bacterium]|nr:hypothetical protein [Planctomycetaceae bacterium]
MMQNPATVDVGVVLLEKIITAFPETRQSALSNLGRSEIWSNDRLYHVVKNTMLPTRRDVKASPWHGIETSVSYSSGGRINSLISAMIQGLKQSPNLADMEQSVRERLTTEPEWQGGEAILAMIELSTGREAKAKERIQKLAATEEQRNGMPGIVAWILGQELDRFDDTREVAIQLLERATASNSGVSISQLEYSAAHRLFDIYVRNGQRQNARDLLLKQISQKSNDQYDQQYVAHQWLENTRWAAQKFEEIQFPVDAIRCYQELLNDSERLEIAVRWEGETRAQLEVQLRKGLKKSLSAVGADAGPETIDLLLKVAQSRRADEPALDLMLLFPEAHTLATQPIESSYTELLTTLSEKPEIAAIVSERLQNLQIEHPDDLSVAAVNTWWKVKMHHPDATGSVSRLLAVVEKHPLEEIADGDRPTTRQRRQAAQLIPMWLIARIGVGDNSLHEQGTRLAEICNAAAARQISLNEQSAILFEWGQRLIQSGHADAAEARWSELLDLATKRPSRSSPEDAGEKVPPLTQAQFRTVITVALSAAENGMPELSRHAVRESLRGGFPVLDHVSTTSRSTVIRSNVGGGSDGGGFEGEVVQSLKRVLDCWNGDAYPAIETCQLVKAIVLPVNRPDEIRMYASTPVGSPVAETLGEKLVVVAHQADQLKELQTAVEIRSANSANVVTSATLLALIALQSDQPQLAAEHLRVLTERTENGATAAERQLALLTAFRCFEVESLKPVAFPVLHQSVRRGLEESSNANSAMPINSSLSTLVVQYLAETGDSKSVHEHFDKVLQQRLAYYSRYAGDYGLYMQRNDMVGIAGQAAELNLSGIALEYLATAADIRIDRYGQLDMSRPFAATVRAIRSLPAEQRYQQWHDWTMPDESRPTIRSVYSVISPTRIPPQFCSEDRPYEVQLDRRLLSNISELVDAARDAGQLNELRAELQPMAEAKAPVADLLLTLVLIAQKDVRAGTTAVRSLQETLPARVIATRN